MREFGWSTLTPLQKNVLAEGLIEKTAQLMNQHQKLEDGD